MGVFVRQNLKTGQALYTNEDAIEKSIKYNTRTGGSKKGMDDLIAYGGVGVTNNDPEQMVEDMLDVQVVYGQQKGRRMHHYTYTVNREEYGRLGCCDDAVELIAKEMAKEAFFDQGFQVEYAIHANEGEKEGYRHIHFVVNSTSYVTGHKYHESYGEYDYKKDLIDKIQDGVAAMCPIRFRDVDKMRLE